jgi:hypothetical protein
MPEHATNASHPDRFLLLLLFWFFLVLTLDIAWQWRKEYG